MWMMKKEVAVVLGILFIGLLIVPLGSSLTASIDKPRMVLYKNITGSKLEFQNSVIVNNVNEGDVQIKITPSGDWKDKMVINEPEFVLKKGETKEVFYIITITEPGFYKGDVLVKFSEGTSKTHVSLAQELEVFVKDNRSSWITGGVIGGSSVGIGIIGLITAIVLIIVLMTLIKSRKENEKDNN